MATGRFDPVLRYLREAAPCGNAGLTDRQLLERFARRRDESAFAVLVRRHGPTVLGVCRRVLRHRHDAEDAFQATFLILARKAGTLRRPDALGPWLHGVAYRTSAKARSAAARRRAREAPFEDLPAAPSEDVVRRDLRDVLDEAIDRLPPKYRVPVVLCYLEGLTNAEAARRLGCPVATVATRLARARRRLRDRLACRGVTLSAAALAALSSRAGAGPVPATLTLAAVRTARNTIPAVGITAFLKGVWQAMLTHKLRTFLVVLAVAAAATSTVAYRATPAPAGEGETGPKSPDAPRPAEADRLKELERQLAALRQELKALRGDVEVLRDELRSRPTAKDRSGTGDGDFLSKLPGLGLGDALADNSSFVNRRRFKIPFSVDRGWRFREITLFASSDQGKSWRECGSAKVEENAFEFEAQNDGTYWFKVAMVDADGQRHPSDPSREPVGLRICVDTRPPTVTVKRFQRDGNDVTVWWEADDDHLDPATLRLEWSAGENPDRVWRRVLVQGTAKGDATFRPEGNGPFTLRLRVRDRAGNEGTDEVSVPARR